MFINKMWKCIFRNLIKLGIVFSVLFVVLYVNLSNQIIKKTDVYKCPFCYGENLCDAFVNVSLKKTVFTAILNILNTKNVFYASFNGDEVVLKKLMGDSELRDLDEQICLQHDFSNDCDISELSSIFDYKEKIWNFLNDRETFRSFKLCSETSAKVMMDFVLKLKASDRKECDFLKNVWTILQVNVEPLILQLLKSDEGWPVPKYYGACGRFIMERYCGTPLTYKGDLNWTDRAWLALQALQMADDFTNKHPYFRFYLTDLSSDNIVVDDNLKLTFIDLENILVAYKIMDHGKLSVSNLENKRIADVGKYHQSEILQVKGFAYSEDAICNSALSDHNYFAVCKLLLSKAAPWPMMKDGLLHSPPEWVANEHRKLFGLIEKCAVISDGTDRITTSKNIIAVLNSILAKALNHANKVQNVEL